MQLPRNDCRIRANVFVILVAANGRAMDKNKDDSGFYPRSAIACGRLFVRMQSPIRADGSPSAQA